MDNFSLFSCFLAIIPLTDIQVEALGERVFFSETGKRKERLIFWNKNEAFPSLGIGHFIWFPEGLETSPFEETFPQLLRFLQESGVEIPSWLDPLGRAPFRAPWKSREEFMAAQEAKTPKMQELQEFLEKTQVEQSLFIARRMEKELDLILVSMEPEKRERAEGFIKELAKNKIVFPLYDYLHFKGSGLTPKERYKGEGWGLKQVLERVDLTSSPLEAFIEAAKKTLEERVHNADPEKGEAGFLPGWLHRIDQYRNSPF